MYTTPLSVIQVKNPLISLQNKAEKSCQYSSHGPTQKTLKILVSIANETGIANEFRCVQGRLADEYGCTPRHTTRLFARAQEEGLLELGKPRVQPNGKGGWETIRYLKLTGRAINIALNSSMILGQDIDAAPIKAFPVPLDPVPIIPDPEFIDLGFAPYAGPSPEEMKEIYDLMYVPPEGTTGRFEGKKSTYIEKKKFRFPEKNITEDMAVRYYLTEAIVNDLMDFKLANRSFKPAGRISKFVNKMVKKHGNQKTSDWFTEHFPIGVIWNTKAEAYVRENLRLYDPSVSPSSY